MVHALERESSEFALAHKAMNNDFRLVVDVPKNTLDAIANGDIKLTTDRAGNTFAQLLDPNGRYGKKLPIKREDFSEGVDPFQAANAIQLRAIQGQLEDIARQIAVIDVRVQEVLEGQQNDRLGILQSGMRLYLQAREVDDETLRKLLISQALRALSDAEAQLELEMESDVKYLANGDYEHEKADVQNSSMKEWRASTVAFLPYTRRQLPEQPFFASKESPRPWRKPWKHIRTLSNRLWETMPAF